MMIDTIGIIAARVIMGEVGETGEGIGKGNRETWGEARVARRPQRVKSKVKGSCGRRRVVAVKAITRHVEAAATS